MKLAIILLAFTIVTPAFATESPIKEEMRFKLFYAQGILEGIVTENFALIATNTYKMRQFSQRPAWDVHQSPEYRGLTADFQRALTSLSVAGEKRNVDAATVYYFQLTTSCVTCHKHLRGTQVSSIAPALPQRLASKAGARQPEANDQARAWPKKAN
jgi:hypothetical protein